MGTRFTISKYLVLKNEPPEVKKSEKSGKLKKSTFCDFAGPRRDLSMEVLKNEASRGSKTPKARKSHATKYFGPPGPPDPPVLATGQGVSHRPRGVPPLPSPHTRAHVMLATGE